MIIPLEDVAERPHLGRVHADPEAALATGRGLLARGLAKPLRAAISFRKHGAT